MTLAGRVALLGTATGAAALAWPTFTDATGLTLPCPLRTITGVPCPGCGLTTASVALVRGRVAEAVGANPVVVVLALVVVAAAVVTVLRATGRVAPPTPWPDSRRSLVLGLAALVALASEAWQLQRALY